MRSMILVLAACAVLSSLLAPVASAQDLVHKAPAQAGPVAVVGARVYTGTEAGDFDPGYVLFDRGEIVAVGAWTDSARSGLPRGCTVVDAEGKRVYPGLIAPRTQLGLIEVQAVRASDDMNEVGAFTPEVRASVSVNPDSWLLPVTRLAGITHAGVFPIGGDVPGRVSVIALDGWTNDDLTVTADAGVIVNWPRVRPVRAPWMRDSDEDQKKEINERLDRIDAFFDSAAAYAAARNDSAATTPIDLRFEACRALFEPGGSPAARPVFISAGELDQIVSAVTWAAGRGLRVVLVGGRDAPMCAELLRTHGVGVIADSTIRFPKREDSPYDDAYTLPARLEAAGLVWTMANADDPAHERNLPHNMGRAVAYGLSEQAALRAMTSSAAELLGVGDLLGTIEPGKSASIIVADGDILEITTSVVRMFIDGRDIELRSKQTDLRDKYRAKYEQLGVSREN